MNLPVRGSLDDSNATAEIAILLTIRKTTSVEAEFSVEMQHKRCNESFEWKFEFKARLETNTTYEVMVLINGTLAAKRLFVILGPVAELTYRAWLEIQWKAVFAGQNISQS